MSSLDDVRAAAASAAAERATVVAAAATQAAAADASDRAAATSAALGDTAGRQAGVAAAAAVRADRRTALSGLTALDDELAAVVAELAADACDAEGDVPLVLLPVRLETRYSADGATLRVRVYPDDAHVDRLDRGVSAAERDAGTAYWTAVWTGSASDAASWASLQTAVHPARAPWVAAATTPTNLAARPDPPAGEPAPAFPDTTEREQRAPVARGLPDRFVVVAVQGGQRSTAVGAPVPAEVVVGLAPDADPAGLVQHGQVTLGPGMQWMSDPVAAAACGLLVEVPLAAPGAPVDLVLAVGVRGSLDPDGGAAELSRLLEAHRYATGAAFVAPGTPTNNTETDRAAWTARPAPTQPPTTVTPDPDPASDAARLAAALGVEASLLAGLDGGDRLGDGLAADVNTALWQPTWGSWLGRMVVAGPKGPSLSDDTRERWRDVWQDGVRGAGPLPSLRLGNQPYGVLPVTGPLPSWVPTQGARFEPSLQQVLIGARRWLVAGVANVPRVPGAPALDLALLEVLGSAPHQLGLRVRSLASASLVAAAGAAAGIALENAASQVLLDLVLWTDLGIDPGTVGVTGSLGATTRPLGLPLVGDDDRAFLLALLADAPRTVTSVLQALLDLALAEETKAVTDLTPPQRVSELLDRAAGSAGELTQPLAQAVQAVQAGKARPEQLYGLAAKTAAMFGPAGPGTQATLQPVAGTRTDLVSLVATASATASANKVAGNLAVAGLGGWLQAQARLAEFRAAVRRLADTTTDERRLAVASTLDCASHRYDAWVTALPAARLVRQRAAGVTGTMLGAYGWVEGLTPGAATTRPGGYVLAPSVTHAATAGVLRSAYLTHNPDAASSGALAVDLSGARVRTALHLLDGLRQGQPMGPLLGYGIERRMHDAGLDRFVLSLRALAPTVAARLTDRADAPPQQARESLTATDVVDGLRLLDLRTRGTDVAAALVAAPADNPYLQPGDWVAPTPAETVALGAVLDAAAAEYDAAADLLLAESVHQLVQGNTARAAATMDAAAGGDAPPVEPEVVRTPVRAAAVTHRLLVLAPSTPPGTGGWSAATPRASAAPELAAWAEGRLGPATTVVVQAPAAGGPVTLDAAGLSALDLVAVSGDAAALERVLRTALPGLDPGPLAGVRDPAWPAGSVALGELAVLAASLARLVDGAEPLVPASLARGSDHPARAVDTSALAGRVDASVTGLTAAAEALAAALAAVPVDPAAVATAGAALAGYGIALPPASGPAGSDAGVAAAGAGAAEARRRLAATAVLLTAGPLDGPRALAVGEELFGTGFRLLAPVVAGPPDLYGSAYAALVPRPAQVRRWLRDVATVRAGAARYAETLLLADGLRGPGAAPVPAVAQLAAAGTAGTGRWLGLPLADGSEAPDAPVTSLLVEAPPGYAPGDPVTGLVLDSWVEQLPRRSADGSVRATTGLAVNANAPGARAPQSVLVAVSPDGARWTSDVLAGVLTETLELARVRAVTLERSVWLGRLLPALQEASWSLQGERTLDVVELTTKISGARFMPAYVKEPTP